MDNDGKGWLVFAAVVLGVAGIMRIFDGIWAFRYKGAVPDHLQNALLGTTLKNYGWLWLIIGIVLILCALPGVRHPVAPSPGESCSSGPQQIGREGYSRPI
jgi:hypothetical protein